MKALRFTLCCIATMLAAPTCSRARQEPPPSHDSAIVVPGDATDRRDREGGGVVMASYHVAIPYPADDLIGLVRKTLDAAGWTPLQEDFLNPGIPSSHARGWTSFDDTTKKPPRRVRQWIGDWADPNGRVVTYAFIYSRRLDSTDEPENLLVSVHLMSAEAAAQIRAQTKAYSLPPGIFGNQSEMRRIEEWNKRENRVFAPGEMLLVTSRQGAALIEFARMDQDSASYRWRFHDHYLGRETTGGGELRQHYLPINGDERNVKLSEDSRTHFRAGSFELDWDIASMSISTGDTCDGKKTAPPGTLLSVSQRVYFFPDEAAVSVLRNEDFDTFDLAKASKARD